MANISKKMPPAGVPFVDPKSGRIDPQWYIFLRNFSNNALIGSGGSGIVVDDNGTLYGRTLTAASTKVLIVNGNGISGNPTVDVDLAVIKPALSLSGTNTGDQTITLTGDVTGSGTGSFAATLANTAVGAGSYTVNGNALFTVDAKGRLTSASNATVTQAQIGIARGSYTVTAGNDTAGTVTINTGLTIASVIINIIRSGNMVSSDPAVSFATTNLTVADGATYVLTTGDKINWVAVS